MILVSACAILSTLVRLAPSAASWAGVLVPVASTDEVGSEDEASIMGSVIGAVVLVMSGLGSSGLVIEAEIVGTVVGVAFRLFFWPAFAAASAPACRMAMVSGVSTLLFAPVVALLLAAVSFGSEMEIWRASEVERAVDWETVGGAESAIGSSVGLDGVVDGVPPMSETLPICCLSSPYSFHSSISSRSWPMSAAGDLSLERGRQHTPTTVPNFTNPGSFRPFDLRPHSIRAFSSVATSRARKGILLALRIVSRRDVAVMM